MSCINIFVTHIKLLILLLLLCPLKAQASWQTLRPGLDYQELEAGVPTPWSRIHAFRVDLQLLKLNITLAKDLGLVHASSQEFAKACKALVTINGGFFDEAYHPLGLRINQYQQKNPLKPISWWGIFYVKHQKAYIANLRTFQKEQPLKESIELALQSGPRLLIQGKIPNLKPGLATRSALCIQKDGQLIIVMSQNRMLTTRELATLMKTAPLHCQDALNLDGGSSSQLYADVGSFHLDIAGFSKVSDALCVQAI